MSKIPQTYQEPKKITEQRKELLQELQKAAVSASGVLQQLLRKIFQVIQKTTPESGRDPRLFQETQMIVQQYLNARKVGKVTSVVPPAIALAFSFMQANTKVLQVAEEAEKSGKPQVIEEIPDTEKPKVTRTIAFDRDHLEQTECVTNSGVLLGEHSGAVSVRSANPHRVVSGWINPALGRISV